MNPCLVNEALLYIEDKNRKNEKKRKELKKCEEKSGGTKVLAHILKLAFALNSLHLTWYIQDTSQKWLVEVLGVMMEPKRSWVQDPGRWI